MGLLGSTTTVAAQAGRKLNNSLTLEFKTSATDTLATAVQKGSAGVLLGFKNGGAGKYVVGNDTGEIADPDVLATMDIVRVRAKPRG